MEQKEILGIVCACIAVCICVAIGRAVWGGEETPDDESSQSPMSSDSIPMMTTATTNFWDSIRGQQSSQTEGTGETTSAAGEGSGVDTTATSATDAEGNPIPQETTAPTESGEGLQTDSSVGSMSGIQSTESVVSTSATTTIANTFTIYVTG